METWKNKMEKNQTTNKKCIGPYSYSGWSVEYFKASVCVCVCVFIVCMSLYLHSYCVLVCLIICVGEGLFLLI